jgi:hypothetical protein
MEEARNAYRAMGRKSLRKGPLVYRGGGGILILSLFLGNAVLRRMLGHKVGEVIRSWRKLHS